MVVFHYYSCGLKDLLLSKLPMNKGLLIFTLMQQFILPTVWSLFSLSHSLVNMSFKLEKKGKMSTSVLRIAILFSSSVTDNITQLDCQPSSLASLQSAANWTGQAFDFQ